MVEFAALIPPYGNAVEEDLTMNLNGKNVTLHDMSLLVLGERMHAKRRPFGFHHIEPARG